MDERWQELPEDLLEKVLQCLPIPTLFRFRAVCKKWNTLLTHPSFKPTALNTSYLFRAPHVVFPWPNPNSTTWELTDTTTQKRYALDDTFLFDHVKHRLHPTQSLRRCTIAADRGLVCVLLLTNTADEEVLAQDRDRGVAKEFLVVVNPVTKWCRDVAPFFVEHDDGFFSPAVALVVGDDMASFRIFVLLQCCVECLERKRAFVFDSEVPNTATMSP